MNKQTPYNENVYKSIDVSDLILFSVYLVTKSKEKCTFERLVAECFNNFPKVFAFKRYPQWPDALKLDRQLRTLREKGLIIGNARSYFSLTKFGRLEAAKVESMLKGNHAKKKNVTPIRSGDDRLIEFIKNSHQFKKFLTNPGSFSLSDSEFRNLMRCTLETPLRIVKQNLEYYKSIANLYNENKLLGFLLKCEEQFFKKKGE